MSLFSSWRLVCPCPPPLQLHPAVWVQRSTQPAVLLHYIGIHITIKYIPHVHLLPWQQNYPVKCDRLNQTNMHDMQKVLIVVLCVPHTHQTLTSISQQQSQKPICHIPCSEDSGSGFGPLSHVPARISATQRWGQQQEQQVQKPLDKTRCQSLWRTVNLLFLINSVVNLFNTAFL